MPLSPLEGVVSPPSLHHKLVATQPKKTSHPAGIAIDIVGISTHDLGLSCKCSKVLKQDVVVYFLHIQLVVKRKEKAAIAVF